MTRGTRVPSGFCQRMPVRPSAHGDTTSPMMMSGSNDDSAATCASSESWASQ